MSPNEVLALLPADEAQQNAALDRLKNVLSSNDSIEGLKAGVESGELKAVTIYETADKPLYVIWYRMDDRTKTLLCAGASIQDEHHIASLAMGLDILAAQLGAEWIEFRTRRKGYARASAPFGYVADTVNLLKKVSANG